MMSTKSNIKSAGSVMDHTHDDAGNKLFIKFFKCVFRSEYARLSAWSGKVAVE